MSAELKRLIAGVQYIQDEVYNDLPLQHLLLFLVVAENEGITMPELAAKLNVPQGTVSRNVKALSKFLRDPTEAEIKRGENKKKIAGHDLLRVEPDLYNRKSLAVSLTEKGEEVLNTLIEKVFGE